MSATAHTAISSSCPPPAVERPQPAKDSAPPAWLRRPALRPSLWPGLLLPLLCGLPCARQAQADELHVAVAANFQAPLQKLAPAFEKATGHRLLVSAASTGKLLAQIRSGAPYDVLLSADDEAPRALAQEGLALDPPQTYAIGRLVLWSAQPGMVDGQGRWLQAPPSQKLALANPKLAPYGRAAQEALQKLDRWEAWRPQLVTGEHIAQAHQFVATGAAPAGFVAAAQVTQAGGSCWLVPEALHQPIRQDLVILKRTGQAAAARALVQFLISPAVQREIEASGYSPARGVRSAAWPLPCQQGAAR